jgi:anti-sigma regulatory factor (Ser/Thr protein kinase)
VNVELAARAGGLDVRVRDEGPGFDPTRVPDPLAPENLSKPSGRGIFLMRMLMDEVAFRQLPDGGMEVTMRKRHSACEEARSRRGRRGRRESATTATGRAGLERPCR